MINLTMPVHPTAILASLLGEQEQYEQSRQLGEDALVQQDEIARLQADISRCIVSYSLFGSEPLYGEGAMLNAQAIQELLPDWQMRVYHDDSLSSELIARLQQAGAQTIAVASVGIAHWPGTFWRFHALTDPHALRVLLRDADSIITPREISCVREWLDSHHPFHVMRDGYTHTELILAGLWGAHAPYLAHIGAWVEQYLMHDIEYLTHDDQLFLGKYIWPRICQHTLVHDSIHPVLGAKDIVAPRVNSDIASTLGGIGATAFPVTLTPALPHQKYWIDISVTASGERICRYERMARDGVDRFRIPSSYGQKIEAGVWKIEVGALP